LPLSPFFGRLKRSLSSTVTQPFSFDQNFKKLLTPFLPLHYPVVAIFPVPFKVGRDYQIVANKVGQKITMIAGRMRFLMPWGMKDGKCHCGCVGAPTSH
jgi:hypothetical protein